MTNLTRRGFVGTVLAAIGLAKCPLLRTPVPRPMSEGPWFIGYSHPLYADEDLEGAIMDVDGRRA